MKLLLTLLFISVSIITKSQVLKKINIIHITSHETSIEINKKKNYHAINKFKQIIFCKILSDHIKLKKLKTCQYQKVLRRGLNKKIYKLKTSQQRFCKIFISKKVLQNYFQKIIESPNKSVIGYDLKDIIYTDSILQGLPKEEENNMIGIEHKLDFESYLKGKFDSYIIHTGSTSYIVIHFKIGKEKYKLIKGLNQTFWTLFSRKDTNYKKVIYPKLDLYLYENLPKDFSVKTKLITFYKNFLLKNSGSLTQ
jgi:hypothetical protein